MSMLMTILMHDLQSSSELAWKEILQAEWCRTCMELGSTSFMPESFLTCLVACLTCVVENFNFNNLYRITLIFHLYMYRIHVATCTCSTCYFIIYQLYLLFFQYMYWN